MLYALPTHGRDLDGTPQSNPAYGRIGVLLGDANGDGRTDNGEKTLFVPLLAAEELLVTSSDSSLDVRQALIRQAIAAQLNIDNGDKDPGLYPGQSVGHDLISEAGDWLRGLAPFNYASGSGNVDTNHDGILEAGITSAGHEYNMLAGAFTSAPVRSGAPAWQTYVDPINAPPQAGDILVNGQDVKNALQAFNIDQLVTSMAGFQIAWDSNGAFSDIRQNTPDASWRVLADNHVIAAPT